MAVGRKGPRKGLKVLKDLKEKKGGQNPPFFERQKGTPSGGNRSAHRCALPGAALPPLASLAAPIGGQDVGDTQAVPLGTECSVPVDALQPDT